MIANQSTKGGQGLDPQKKNIALVINWKKAEQRSQSIVIKGGPGQGLLKVNGTEVVGHPLDSQMNGNQNIESGQGQSRQNTGIARVTKACMKVIMIK